MPDALLAAVQAPRGRSTDNSSGGVLSGELPATEWLVENGFQPGQRNNQAFRLACRLLCQHWPYTSMVIDTVRAAWEQTEDRESFPWVEVERVLESAQERIIPQLKDERTWIENLRGGGWSV